MVTVGKTVHNPKGRIICVGDTHGCLQETLMLLEKCQATSADRVILLGDLVDRGPDSAGCVDLAMRLEKEQGTPACVLGNHEDRHIGYDDIERRKGHVDVRIPTHIDTRKQLRPEHYDYFRSLPHFIRLPEHNAAVVHAGAFPNVQLEQQRLRHLLHTQMINPAIGDDSIWPSKVPANEESDWGFWTRYWNGPERLIFGHTVLDMPLVSEHAVGIDGGVCFGMELHALILPGWQIVTVKSGTNASQGSRGRTGKAITKYKIHGDVSAFS